MEQTSYNRNLRLEVVCELLRERRHIRGLAKKLGVNHMNVVRKIRELYGLNVVDYNAEGKNKVYFLKDSIEAREFVFMAEHYKLLIVLKGYPSLRRIIGKIQEDKRIGLVVLFGSYAKGIAKKGSDIDIYVESENREVKKDLEKIDSKISVKMGKFDKGNLLIKEVVRNHVIIKGVERYYEINKFFEET